MFFALLKLLRVHHWIKNLLVFTTAILTFQLTNAECLSRLGVGFAIFCLSASAVYIINDLRDLENDRRHPQKCKRPLASGAISVAAALVILLGIFLCMCAAMIFLAIREDGVVVCVKYFAIPIFYIAINIAYSAGLKNVPILDIFILMSGYLLRVLYGGIVAGTGTSGWVLLTVMSFSFFMGFGKRRNELQKYGSEGRKILRFYTKEFLDKGLQLSLSMSVIFYALVCNDRDTVPAQNGKSLLWTVPVIFVLCLRYVMLLENDSDGDPVSVALSDVWLRLIALLYVFLVFFFLYIL